MSYRCVVCQEEITEKEHNYSKKLFNMALCRKHQDIQKQIKAKSEPEQKTNSIKTEPKNSDYCCIICKEKITSQEHSYSTSLFNMALCRKHQDIQKQIRAKAETELKTAPEPKNNQADNKNVIPPINTLANSQNILIKWVNEWVIGKPINLSPESKHFFVAGMELEELARDAIGKAQDEILVTSPYLDNCFLATALQRAVERRVKVKVVARRPIDPKTQKIDVPKAECQDNLKKEGVIIHYINQIHSKIIIIDRKVTVISSMNFYGGSTGGATLEAGILSFDKTVVDSAVNYVMEQLEKPESPEGPNALSKPYYRNTRRY